MTIHNVSNDSEFSTALSAAVGGDTIMLAAGSTYGTLNLGNKSTASELLITTDSANRAECTKLLGDGCNNIKVEYLRVQSNHTVQGGSSNFTSSGCAVLIENYGSGMILSRMQVYGEDATPGAQIPDYTFCGVSWVTGTGGRMEYCEVKFFRNVTHLQNYNGLVFFGCWLHHVCGGDFCVLQTGDAFTFEEMYLSHHIYNALPPTGGGTHVDGIQAREQNGPLRGPYVIKKCFIRSNDEGFFQSLLMQNDPTDVTVEDVLVYNGQVYGCRFGGSTGAICRRGAFLHNPVLDTSNYSADGADPRPTIQFDSCTGFLEASDNVTSQAILIAGTTPALDVNTNNRVVARASYVDYLKVSNPGADATLDDLRPDPNKTDGAAVIAAGQGPTFWRSTGSDPAGYTLATGGSSLPQLGPSITINLTR